MNISKRFLAAWLLIATLLTLPFISRGSEPIRDTESGPIFSDRNGLQLSLDTSGYRFRAGPRAAFSATAILSNRSNTGVPFVFASQYDSEQYFRFRVLNKAGEQVWESDMNVRIIPGVTPRVLKPRQVWRRSVQVPLNFEGQPLPAGQYTLIATIAGTPALGATTVFEVVGNPATRAELVYSVDGVAIRYIPTLLPPNLIAIEAKGTVPTGGWTNPELRRRGITRDGIIEFDFVAQPPAPDTIVTQAFTPVTASTQTEVPDNFAGVRVHARTNSREAKPPR